MSTSVAVGVSVASGTCFAIAATLQHRTARNEPHSRIGDPRLLLRLLRRRLWLIGGAADVAGVALQTLALSLGALAVVQPVLLSGLILAVPLQALLERRPPHLRDLRGVSLAALGLATFLLAATPQPGISGPATHSWLWIALAIAPILLGCVWQARRSTDVRRTTYLGVLTGLLYGLTAALLKTCADRLGQHPVALLTGWQLYALLLIGALALIVNQNAFQGHDLAAPLTALTLTEPVVAVLIGVTAFGEHLTIDVPRSIVLILATAAMGRGIWLTNARAEAAT